MYRHLLEDLDRAISDANPILHQLLNSGIPRCTVENVLKETGIDGYCEPVVSLFHWRNGAARSQIGTGVPAFLPIFPELPFEFLSLDSMIVYFRALKRAEEFHPVVKRTSGRYFPIFSDLSDMCIAVDLKSPKGAIRALSMQSETFVIATCPSFEKFLKDCAVSIREKATLPLFDRCF